MRVEDRRLSRRSVRPALIAALLVAALAIPLWLWIERGRKLPLEVVIDPPRYVVKANTTLPLRARTRPDSTELSWSGPGVVNGTFTAPQKPGLYTVKLEARRSGTTAEDSVTLLVTKHDPTTYVLSRPPAPPVPPGTDKPCDGTQPKVRLGGRPCRGATIVVSLEGAEGHVWHYWHDESHAPLPGRMLDVVIPRTVERGKSPTIVSLLQPSKKSCLWTLRTPVAVEDCDAGPRNDALFAAFNWRMVGPGHFRFAALPPRGKAPPSVKHYTWDFGGGATKTTKAPQVAHRFASPQKHYRRVKLTVHSSKGSATTERVAVDRSVSE